MSKYLMLINIGPVQDFIATARRSRDLWFGSWFLSEISKTAAEKIVKKFKCENLIFPAVLDPNDLNENTAFNAANKILAIIDENPQIVGSEIKSAVDERFKKIYAETFDVVGRENFNYELAEKQLKDLIEFYWTAVEFDGSDEKYPEARKKVEYLTAARKNTRQFSRVKWGANVPKSSLDGKRESVIFKEDYPKPARPNDSESDKQERKQKIKALYDKFRIRDREQLCGVGLFKRLGYLKDENGNKVDNFFSTSHIAAKPLMSSLKNNINDQKLEFYRTLVSNLKAEFKKSRIKEHLDSTPANDQIFGKMDGHLLYEDRMRDYLNPETEKREIAQAQNAIKEFFGKAFGNESLKPSPYYALLLADGDNMGKAIDAKKTPDEHRKISEALSGFAKSVKKIVNEDHQGSLFYAGGDDVLALVPLHTALCCAKELNKNFADYLKDFEYEDEQTKEIKTPTLSVGIAVAHHLEPLSDALELVRKAEKTAKSVDGKNALAIIVDKRSGTSRTLKGQFSKGIIEYLRQLIKFDKKGDVSRQAAYELRDLARRLEIHGDKSKDENLFNEEEKNLRQKFVEIKQKEAKRIIKRKLKNVGSEKFNETDYFKLFERLEDKNGAEKLADELITAKIFADAEKTAGMNDKPEEKENV